MAAQDRLVEGKLVVGYTTQDHLILDLDDLSHYKAIRIGRMIQKSFLDVGIGLLLHSSRWHYHIVYDAKIGWERIMQIVKTLAALGVVDKEYVDVRTFRHDLTLRVSPKSGDLRYRPTPEPIGLFGPKGLGKPSYGIPKYLRLLGTFKELDFGFAEYGYASTGSRD